MAKKNLVGMSFVVYVVKKMFCCLYEKLYLDKKQNITPVFFIFTVRVFFVREGVISGGRDVWGVGYYISRDGLGV